MAEGDAEGAGESAQERWDARHRQAGASVSGGGFLEDVRALLPEGGRALDVACGRGALCLWLAQQGFAVTGVDVSPVAIGALETAARTSGVQVPERLRGVVLDVERSPGELPAGPFELIACTNYRQPSLVPELIARLSEQGVLVLEQHTVDNLQRHAKPSRRFLAERGELASWVRQSERPMELLFECEGWVEGRAVARVIARVV